MIFFLIINVNGIRSEEKTDSIFEIPPKITFIRAYGGNDELKPPVLILSDKSNYSANLGSDRLTIEFDVAAKVPPVIYAKLIHCSVDWNESDNVFLNDDILSRTTLFDWEAAPMYQNYYGYRARVVLPNQQIKINFSGNWKVKIFDMINDELLAETRIFVVQPRAQCYIAKSLDFYKSIFKVSNIAINFEGIVSTSSNLIDGMANTAVVYKNNRWYEPYFISDKINDERNNRYRYKYRNWVKGILYNGKSFRIEGIPAENAYRILNLSDIAYFPPGIYPVRLPFSDMSRNGTYFDIDDDGAMIKSGVPPEYNDYALVDFTLDSRGKLSDYDVLLSGSFNNWNPDYRWRLNYDFEEKVYKLRAWVPRGRHNYLYSVGKINNDNNLVTELSYDEYEGNTTTANQSYIMLFYYHETDYGGYDSIIAVTSTSLSRSIFK